MTSHKVEIMSDRRPAPQSAPIVNYPAPTINYPDPILSLDRIAEL